MYRNVLGDKVSRARWAEMLRAAKNRRELVAARFNRRELLKAGLLTTGGYLIPKRGLSAHWGSPMPEAQAASPPVQAFVEPLPIMPIKAPIAGLNPAPALIPNLRAGEARTRPHQALLRFPPEELYQVVQREAQISMSRSLPVQTIWGFDGMSPGPTHVARYGKPIVVRNVNQLPPAAENGGFGLRSVSTHLHNGHTPSESDGFRCKGSAAPRPPRGTRRFHVLDHSRPGARYAEGAQDLRARSSREAGWTFLTGRPGDIGLLRRKLGFADPDAEVDKNKASHIGNVRYGNRSCCGRPAPDWPMRGGSPSRSRG